MSSDSDTLISSPPTSIQSTNTTNNINSSSSQLPPASTSSSNNCGSCNSIVPAGKGRCGRCKKVSYCNATCQRAHWNIHKSQCQPSPSSSSSSPPSPSTTSSSTPKKSSTNNNGPSLIASAPDPPPPYVGPPRAAKIAAAVKFLKTHIASSTPLIKSIKFLHHKGLSPIEMATALREGRPKSIAVARAFENAATKGDTTTAVVERMTNLANIYSSSLSSSSAQSPSLTSPSSSSSSTRDNDDNNDDDENIGLDLSKIDPTRH